VAQDEDPKGLTLISVFVAIALLLALIVLVSLWGCNRWGSRKNQQNTRLQISCQIGAMPPDRVLNR